MNYIQIMGGLGNQLFQYAFAKYIELKTNSTVTLYTGFYDIEAQNACISKRELYFDQFNLEFTSTNESITTEGIITEAEFNSYEIPDNVLFNGYWQNKNYFLQFHKEISSMFRLKEKYITPYMASLSHEMKSCDSISIHVRRTDYLNQYNKDIFYEISLDYYISAVKYITEQIGHSPVLYIFSDDYDYIDQNMRNICNIKTVIIKPGTAYEDLYLMTQAKHHIIANSTFSWWGAALAQADNGITVAPKHWFKDRKNPELYLSDWIIMDNKIKLDKISVIVPAYNVSKYIERCLDSIENQTFGIDNLEIILINDASTDDSLTYLEAFEKKYPENVILINREKNCGLGAARNIGLQYVTGKYITFIDSDDFIDVSMLYKMYSKAQQYDCDVVECGYKMVSCFSDAYITYDIEQPYYLNFHKNEDERLMLFNSGKCAVWSRLYKATFIMNNNLSFVEGLLYEDVPFTGQYFFLINSYYRINETLYYYYYNPEGISFSCYKPERMHQETTVAEMLLVLLHERNMLDRILNDQRKILLINYIITKSFIDPLTMLLKSNLSFIEIIDEIHFFKSFLYDTFPNVINYWQISDQQEISKLAFYLLNKEHTISENSFKNYCVKKCVFIYDSDNPDITTAHSTFNTLISKTSTDYSIVDIGKTLYIDEHLLFCHAINEQDIICIFIDELFDNASQLQSISYIEKILKVYTTNEIIISFRNIYYDETDDCAKTISSLVNIINSHSNVSLIIFDDNSYNLLAAIIPSVKMFLQTNKYNTGE